MKSGKSVMLLSLGALALTPVLSQPAAAQVVGTGQAGYVTLVKSSVAGCPSIGFRLARHTDGTIAGIAYYADGSGVSAVAGTFDSAGKTMLTLTSSMGKGPVGTVNAQRSQNGALAADLKGEGCANAHLTVQAVPDTFDAGGG